MRAKFHGASLLVDVLEQRDSAGGGPTYWVSNADMYPFTETYSTSGLDLKVSMAAWSNSPTTTWLNARFTIAGGHRQTCTSVVEFGAPPVGQGVWAGGGPEEAQTVFWLAPSRSLTM